MSSVIQAEVTEDWFVPAPDYPYYRQQVETVLGSTAKPRRLLDDGSNCQAAKAELQNYVNSHNAIRPLGIKVVSVVAVFALTDVTICVHFIVQIEDRDGRVKNFRRRLDDTLHDWRIGDEAYFAVDENGTVTDKSQVNG